MHYRKLAAERALVRSASREAFEHALQGRQLLAHLPETPERVLYELPILLTYISEGLVNGLN